MVLAKDVAQLIADWDGSTTGIYHLTDGEHPRFCDLEDTLAQTCSRKLPWQLPLSLLNLAGRVGDRLQRWYIPFPLSTARLQKMTQTLTFSDAKARKDLGWSPQPVLDYLANLST
jgi:nucleoside-diphosphate-sugar epimerase